MASEISITQYPKSTIPLCVGQSGWFARIVRQKPADSSSGGGSSSVSTPVDPPPEWIDTEVIERGDYIPNDDALIRQLNAQYTQLFNDGNCSVITRYEGGGNSQPRPVTDYICQGGDSYAKQLRSLSFQINRLTPGQYSYRVRIVRKRNPAYRPPESVPEDERKYRTDFVSLNNRFRETQWRWLSTIMLGTLLYEKQVFSQTVPIPFPQFVTQVDFIFCGCGTGEVECRDCCVSCCSVAKSLYQILVAPTNSSASP